MAQQVVFHSRFSNYELVRVCKDDRPLGNNRWINETRGIKFKFTAAPDPAGRAPVDAYDQGAGGGLIGVYTATVGQNRMVDGEGWLAADAERGIERDDVEALMAHYAFAKAQDGEVGAGDFWLAGYEPEQKLPRPQDFRRDVIAAVAPLDEDKILAMLRDELASHARPELIETAETALAQVRAERAKLEQARAEEQAANTWSPDDKNARLQDICDRHGIEVVGTGANGLVKKEDLIGALRGHEELKGMEQVPA